MESNIAGSKTDAARHRTSGTRIRPVALPVEHGGWSFVLEPIALGLLVAPSLAGLCLSIAALGAFLTRHPLKIVVADRRRGRRFPRTVVAERFALAYALIGASSLLAAAAAASGQSFLLPLLAASPFAAAQMVYDLSGRGRSLAAELTGALALASVSSAVAVAGGWGTPAALALWALLAARFVPAILYVRARLSEMHGGPRSIAPTLVAHALALVAIVSLTLSGVAPLLAALVICVLLLRAVHGFHFARRQTTAKQVGMLEVGYGTLTVLACASGYLLG